MDAFSPEALRAAIVREEPARPPRRDIFTSVALPVFIGGNALDGISTLAATRRGAVEQNPVMGTGGVANVAMKAGVNALVAYVLNKYHKDHPKLTTGLALGLGAGMGVIGAHNIGVLRGQHQP